VGSKGENPRYSARDGGIRWAKGENNTVTELEERLDGHLGILCRRA